MDRNRPGSLTKEPPLATLDATIQAITPGMSYSGLLQLAEMKSCHTRNLHSQVRRGSSQLLEYRFVYRDILGRQPTLVLVIETSPPGTKMWLVDCLSSLEITLAWKESRTNRLVTTASIRPALEGVVFACH